MFSQPLRNLLWLAVFFFLLLNCAYFNLFYNAQSYFKEGEKLLASNPTQSKEKFNKAKEKSLLVIKKYPKSRYTPSALFLASLCHYHLQEYEKAKERFSLFLSLYPRHKLAPSARFYQALSYLKSGETSEGIFRLRLLAEENKREARKAKFEIYASLLNSGKPLIILDSLEDFITLYPKTKESDSARILLANAYFSLGEYEKSRSHYERYFQGIADKKRRSFTLLKIGECLLRGKTDLETLSLFLTKLASIIADYPEVKNKANLLKGKILFALAHEEKALSSLREVRGGEEGAESYFLIGEYYEKKGDFNRSLIYYDTAKTFSPTSEFALLAEKKKKLLERFSSAESLSPATKNFALAETYLLSLGKPADAVKEYEKVFRSFPEDSLAPKSLYAVAWIKKFVLKEERDGDSLFHLLLSTYPKTEYAKEGARILKGRR